MRKVFAKAILEFYNTSNTFFLTGDLGFMALEEIQEAFGSRFINCGIAEQNMVSVAAGLAKEGFSCFVYSIAPFIYARPYEQIRNDICFSSLPVCLVGNGGGYAYGHMGPTHHALEDCAAMRSLGVRVLVPCFNEDLKFLIKNINSPTYLRLGQDVKPEGFVPLKWEPWRLLLKGDQGIWVTLGPLAGLALSVLSSYPEKERPALWACGEFVHPPKDFLDTVSKNILVVFEEHVAEGGLGMFLIYSLACNNITVNTFTHRYALRYPSKKFGCQTFHRTECGMDIQAMHDLLMKSR